MKLQDRVTRDDSKASDKPDIATMFLYGASVQEIADELGTHEPLVEAAIRAALLGRTG